MTRVETERLESLQVLLQQNPDSLTFARVAEALMRNGRLEEAIQICEEGVRRHPYYVTGHFVLGKCYRQKKLYDLAEKEFKRVLLFDPKHIAALRHYGDLMREIEWDNTCEMSYRKILHIDPLDDFVQSVVDEFARQSQAAPTPLPAVPPEKVVETPAAAKTRPSKAPLTALPITDDELLDASSKRRDAQPKPVVRTEPPAHDYPKKVEEPEDEPDEQVQPLTGPLTNSDEARFSSILDDIFNDEVLEDTADRFFSPTNDSTSSETPIASLSGEDDFEIEPVNAAAAPPAHDETETVHVPEPEQESAAEKDEDQIDDETPAPPSQTIRSRPSDFDLDFSEIPPAGSPNAVVAREVVEEFASKSAPPSNRRRPTAVRFMEQLGEAVAPPSIESQPRDKIVTPTLGEIYAAQGQYAKAIGVFELLSKKDPANRQYRDKIDYLKKRLQETQNAG